METITRYSWRVRLAAWLWRRAFSLLKGTKTVTEWNSFAISQNPLWLESCANYFESGKCRDEFPHRYWKAGNLYHTKLTTANLFDLLNNRFRRYSIWYPTLFQREQSIWDRLPKEQQKRKTE